MRTYTSVEDDEDGGGVEGPDGYEGEVVGVYVVGFGGAGIESESW